MKAGEVRCPKCDGSLVDIARELELDESAAFGLWSRRWIVGTCSGGQRIILKGTAAGQIVLWQTFASQKEDSHGQ